MSKKPTTVKPTTVVSIRLEQEGSKLRLVIDIPAGRYTQSQEVDLTKKPDREQAKRIFAMLTHHIKHLQGIFPGGQPRAPEPAPAAKEVTSAPQSQPRTMPGQWHYETTISPQGTSQGKLTFDRFDDAFDLFDVFARRTRKK